MCAGMRRPRHQPLRRPASPRKRRVVKTPRAHWVCPVTVLVEKKLEAAQLALPVIVQLHRPCWELENFLLRGAVQSLRPGAHQAHVPEAPTTLAEWLAAATRRVEARLEQGIHTLDLIHEVSELGGELREGVTHDGLVVRLAGGDHVELLLHVRPHRRKRQLGVYAVIPLYQRYPEIRGHHPSPALAPDRDVLPALDVVYVRGYGRVRADAVALHQSDELSLGQVRRGRGGALLQLHRRDRQRLASFDLSQWAVLDGPVRHHRGPPRRDHGLATHAEPFAARHQRGPARHVSAVGRHGRDEVPRDEVVQPPRLPAAHRTFCRRTHGRDGRVVALVLATTRFGHGPREKLLHPLAPVRVAPLRL
mmetsp:Transcript_11983/g.46516  ORF Transcript_11983/g.46516 Transcript_11983/m.46516 type:complete len:363 (+) Transcript_11983:508-1596(+)